MNMMLHAFEAQSPRLAPRKVGWPSRLIGAVGPVLFVALTVQAFLRTSVAGWSVGIGYILYDTALLLFTAWSIRCRPLHQQGWPLNGRDRRRA